MNSIDLVLLSTEHCSLCDQALDLLLSMPELGGRPLQVLDVAQDPELVDRYGQRLPVLRLGPLELDWPFTRHDVLAAL